MWFLCFVHFTFTCSTSNTGPDKCISQNVIYHETHLNNDILQALPLLTVPVVPVKVEQLDDHEWFTILQEQERRSQLGLPPLTLKDDDEAREWLKFHENATFASVHFGTHQHNSSNELLSLPLLPYEIISKITEWIPTVKDLMNLSHTSKKTKEHITVEVLVKTAMMQGGRPRMSIEQLVPLMRKQSIFPPSPNRLLCLLNGKVCEVCCDNPNKNGKNYVLHVRDGWGLFQCWNCCKKMSKRFYKTDVDFLQDARNCILNNERTNPKRRGWRNEPIYSWEEDAQEKLSQLIEDADSNCIEWELKNPHEGLQLFRTRDAINYLMRRSYIDRRGERAGPIFSGHHFQELTRILSSFHSKQEMDERYNIYLQDVLQAPDDNDPRYGEFLTVYEDVKEAADHQQKVRQRNRLTASSRWRMKKATDAVAFVQKLKDTLQNNIHRPLLNYQTNILFYYTNRKPYSKREAPLIMHYRWVDDFLYKYLMAPAKSSRTTNLKQIAELFVALAEGDHSDIEMNEVHSLKHDGGYVYCPPGVRRSVFWINHRKTAKLLRDLRRQRRMQL